jgi:Domain of unknown function (DUF5666)
MTEDHAPDPSHQPPDPRQGPAAADPTLALPTTSGSTAQRPPPAFYDRLGSPSAVRLAIVALAGLVLLISAAVVIAASPSPSSDAGTAPPPSSGPGTVPGGGMGPGMRGFGGLGPALGSGPRMGGPAVGFGGAFGREITITAVDGSNVSLKTADGWSRTITITSSMALTKGGQTISVSDLKVGDTVTFQQTRNSDGTYTVTALQVVVPVVSGSVSAVSDSGFSLESRDGTSWTVNVDASTKYSLGSARSAGSKSDVKVGSEVVVQGTQSSGNTIAAISVAIAQPRVSGEVTAKTASTITIKKYDGTTQVINVTGSTTYHVSGSSSATLAQITVGMAIVAEGTQNSDGTLTATSVSAGWFGPGGTGHGPKAAQPSSSPSSSGTTNG